MLRLRLLLAFITGAVLRRYRAGRAESLEIDFRHEERQHREAKQLLAVSEAQRACLQVQIDGMAKTIAYWEAREEARARRESMKHQPIRQDDNLSAGFSS